jgi:hypothetical protein
LKRSNRNVLVFVVGLGALFLLYDVADTVDHLDPSEPHAIGPAVSVGPAPSADGQVFEEPPAERAEAASAQPPAEQAAVAAPLLDPSAEADRGARLWSAQHAEELVSKAWRLEQEILRLESELDACRSGGPEHSAVGAAQALPEWPRLTEPQRRRVLAFLEQFPVRLQPGEAEYLATYSSPLGNTTSDLVKWLGQRRVLESMPEGLKRLMQEQCPEQFEECFGSGG